MATLTVILGCGDIGSRLVLSVVEQGADIKTVVATNRSGDIEAGAMIKSLDLDFPVSDLSYCHGSNVYFLIPPQTSGQTDQRTKRLLSAFEQQQIIPNKVVLLSTTGVYGDSGGDWVDETSPCLPLTDRARRRLNAEQQWLQWGEKSSALVVVIRVPGIYARSRIPRQRLAAGTPVVRPAECGFTNRIHADDLVQVLSSAMCRGEDQQIYNASDGCPGKVSEFLQAAAHEIGLPRLEEIGMQQACEKLSQGMMSYLLESRRISNKKMLSELNIRLRYPDFADGLKYG